MVRFHAAQNLGSGPSAPARSGQIPPRVRICPAFTADLFPAFGLPPTL